MGETGAVGDAPSATTLRRTMVERQLRTFDVHDLDVLTAFNAVPREAFVEARLADVAYSDRPLASSCGRRVLMSPMTLARLLQEADVKRGDRALDVAGGSGYSAAVLAQLAASVVAVETTAPTGGARIEPVAGPVAQGCAANGPYDLIVVNGAMETRPDALLEQLAEGGRLVGFERSGAACRAVRYDKFGGSCSRRTLFNAAAPSIEEFREKPAFAF